MSDDMRAIAYELSNSDGETIIIRSERHQVESYKNRYSTDLVNELVRQSDALAKLAEKDAEIARLREALEGAKTFHEEQDKAISKQPPSAQGQWRRHQHQEQIENIEEALKGGNL